MGRESVAHSTMVEMLIQETASRSGRRANALGQQIRLTKHDGEPNWNAECGIVGIVESQAFRDAVKHLQAIYDVN